MNEDKEIIKKILSQFTTQRDGFLYEIFEDDIFRKNHPEALWFFNAYDYAYDNYLKFNEKYYCDLPEVVAQARAMMTGYLVKQLYVVTLGLDLDFVTALSSEVQEQRSAEGLSICLLPSSEDFRQCQSSTTISFAEEDKKGLCHEKVHAVRKQLELAKDGSLGVCMDINTYNLRTEGILDKGVAYRYPRIMFKKHSEWELHMPSKDKLPSCRLRYAQGSFMLPLLDMSEEYEESICAKLHNMSKAKAREAASNIRTLLPAIEKCDHGAVVIFLEESIAVAEAQRLTSMGRGLLLPAKKPLRFCEKANAELISRMASIDGAILADLDGNCHAYGVILDGKADNKENNTVPSDGSCKDRGARYNSTKTYIDSFQTISASDEREAIRIGIVRSEDGMLNIFP